MINAGLKNLCVQLTVQLSYATKGLDYTLQYLVVMGVGIEPDLT